MQICNLLGERVVNSIETIAVKLGGTVTNSTGNKIADDLEVIAANVDSGGGGTDVVANPTLTGTEADLTGLQVGDTKYKVGGSGGGVLVIGGTVSGDTIMLDKTWKEIHDAGFAVLAVTNSGISNLYVLTMVGENNGTYAVKFGDDIYVTNSENGYPSVSIDDNGGTT